MPTAITKLKRKTASAGDRVLRAESFADYPLAGARIQHPTGRRLDLLRRQVAQSRTLRQHDTPANVERNRELFLTSRRVRLNDDGSLWPLAQVKQIHSAIIHRVDAASNTHPQATA